MFLYFSLSSTLLVSGYNLTFNLKRYITCGVPMLINVVNLYSYRTIDIVNWMQLLHFWSEHKLFVSIVFFFFPIFRIVHFCDANNAIKTYWNSNYPYNWQCPIMQPKNSVYKNSEHTYKIRIYILFIWLDWIGHTHLLLLSN